MKKLPREWINEDGTSMNFQFLPLVHRESGFWWTLGSMSLIAVALGMVFWRKRYLAAAGRSRG